LQWYKNYKNRPRYSGVTVGKSDTNDVIKLQRLSGNAANRFLFTRRISVKKMIHQNLMLWYLNEDTTHRRTTVKLETSQEPFGVIEFELQR